MPIGLKVTLRADRMWEFYDRLVNITIPRIRDLRGFSADGFDGKGNYTLGLPDQLVFPEVDYTKVEHLHGMNITIVTNARGDEGARRLLEELGFPFARK
jgi:large subunit ribosomal protein L5